MKKYKFVGEGAGVPGLPHEITDTEAEALGLSELLEAAVGCGNYQIVDDGKGRGTPPLQDPSRRVRIVKKDDEVKHEQ